MTLAVDKPILNNPFEEPSEYWICTAYYATEPSGRLYGSNKDF